MIIVPHPHRTWFSEYPFCSIAGEPHHADECVVGAGVVFKKVLCYRDWWLPEHIEFAPVIAV